MMQLFDISSMPKFNPSVPNGANSVSEGKVFFGKLDNQSSYAVESPQCKKHGALLCVAKTESGKIWRCEVCNEGCYTKTQESQS